MLTFHLNQTATNTAFRISFIFIIIIIISSSSSSTGGGGGSNSGSSSSSTMNMNLYILYYNTLYICLVIYWIQYNTGELISP